MGLSITHGCWDGTYSVFTRWRKILAMVAGIPPLDLMDGYYLEAIDILGSVSPPFRVAVQEWKRSLPIQWTSLKPDVLHVLLTHSDCEGMIPLGVCGTLAERLEELISLLPEKGGVGLETWQDKTQQFVDGLRLAESLGEQVKFL